MFVEATINGKAAKNVMVDTGATHNFISKVEGKRLGLKLEKNSGRMKAINLKALPTMGMAKKIPLKLGSWEGHTDMIAVSMDDFDVVLDMKFLMEEKTIPIPFVNILIMLGEPTGIIPTKIK